MKKKSLLLLALSAMVIGGCSKSEIDDGSINSTNAISFETSANKLTKAAVLDNTFEKGDAFGVYAYQTGQSDWSSASTKTEFMVNQDVIYNGTSWSYTPMKYWPNSSGEKISFFGYMPYSAETVASIPENSTLPQLVFSQIMDAEDMLDLTVAKALDQTKTTSAVVLPFEHVTTRLNFSAKVDHDLTADGTTDATYVYVSGLRVLGSSENDASKLYSKATYVMSDDTNDNGAWDYTTTEPTVSTADLDVTPILSTTEYNLGSTPTTLTAVRLGQTTTATSLLTSGQYLFLIPVDGDNGVSAETDIQLAIDYSIITTDETLAEKIAKSDATATMSLPNGTLKEGVAYNIVMTIGVDKVVVEAEAITGWSTEQTAYIDYEVASASAIEDALTAAFTADQDEVKVTYTGSGDALSIIIPDATANPDMTITLDLTTQTGNVTITTDSNYTGALYINAPNAEVTLDGTTYTGLTAATKANTLIIPAGVTVDGLTIEAGNVVVYGTLKGDVVKSATNTEGTTTITVMSGGICVAGEDTTIGEGITLNATPTADGVYYSVDNSAWSNNFTTITDGTSISVMGVGSVTLSSDNLTTIAGKSYENVDLGSVNYVSETFPAVYGNLTASSANTHIKSMVLPANTTTLYEDVFSNCTSLADIDLSKITTLYRHWTSGNVAYFRGCALTSVDLSSLTTFTKYESSNDYPSRIFINCQSLKDVKLNNNLTSLPDYTFYGCSSLESVEYTENIETVGNYAFYGCDLLESIDLSAAKTIGNSTFEECVLLKSVTANNVTTFGTRVFYGCNSLGNDFIPSLSTNITAFPTSMFYECDGITTVVIPDNITTIGNTVFAGSGLEDLTISANVETVGTAAFYSDNKKFSKITIDDNCRVTTWTSQAFSGTVAEEIVFPAATTTLEYALLINAVYMHTIVVKSSSVVGFSTTNQSSVYGMSPFGIFRNTGSYEMVGSLVPDGVDKIIYVANGLKSAYTDPDTIDGLENFWKTELIEECGFEVVELDSDGNIPSDVD